MSRESVHKIDDDNDDNDDDDDVLHEINIVYEEDNENDKEEDKEKDKEDDKEPSVFNQFQREANQMSHMIVNKALMPWDVERYYDQSVNAKSKSNFYTAIGLIHLKHMTKIGSTRTVITWLMVFIFAYVAIIISLVYGSLYIFDNYALNIIQAWKQKFPKETAPVDFIKPSEFEKSEISTFQKVIDVVTEIIDNHIPDFTKVYKNIISICGTSIGTSIFTVALFRVFILFGDFKNNVNNRWYLIISLFAILFIFIYFTHINTQYSPLKKRYNDVMMGLLMLMFTLKGSVEWIYRQFIVWTINSRQENDRLDTTIRKVAADNEDFREMLSMVEKVGTQHTTGPLLLATSLRTVFLKSDPQNRTMRSGPDISHLESTNYAGSDVPKPLVLRGLQGFQSILTFFDFSSMTDRFARLINDPKGIQKASK